MGKENAHASLAAVVLLSKHLINLKKPTLFVGSLRGCCAFRTQCSFTEGDYAKQTNSLCIMCEICHPYGNSKQPQDVCTGYIRGSHASCSIV